MDRRCVVVGRAGAAEGPTGVHYAAGISASSAGARGLCLQLASLPPGARSNVHRHDEHESAAYVLEGEMELRFGDALEHRVLAARGDFIYIPDGVAHVVANPSDRNPAVAVLARTDPRAQEDVTALPELEALVGLARGARP
jgi:uncharacterized RmlC-like cupin family protein